MIIKRSLKHCLSETGWLTIDEPYVWTAEIYDDLYKEEQFTKYEYLKDILTSPKSKDSLIILDIGCGTGLLHEYLLTHRVNFGKYVCLDPSEHMLRFAEEKSRGDYRTITVLGYGENLPIRDGVAGLALMITVWDNLTDKLKALLEIKRVLEATGLSIVSRHRGVTGESPSELDPAFRYIGECLDKFYAYHPLGAHVFKKERCLYTSGGYRVIS